MKSKSYWMINAKWLLLSVVMAAQAGRAQTDVRAPEGAWQGNITADRAFHFEITIMEENPGNYRLSITNDHMLTDQRFTASKDRPIACGISRDLSFLGTFSPDGDAIDGFFRSGSLQYHVHLAKADAHAYTGTWNILMVEQLRPSTLYLNIEKSGRDTYEVCPVFADKRFTGTWCTGFVKHGDSIFFADMKTGMRFRGSVAGNGMMLNVLLGEAVITSISLGRAPEDGYAAIVPTKRSRNNKAPSQLEDGWETSTLKAVHMDEKPLGEMANDIYSGALPNIHSVLIARGGKLVFEQYFSGYDESVPHEMCAASKSVASAVAGIAIDEHMVDNPRPRKYRSTLDEKGIKGNILLLRLLTMSSGLDALDSGTPNNPMDEEYNYPATGDGTKATSEAPLTYAPGMHANYSALDSAVREPLSVFIDQHLFIPLGITDYVLQDDMDGRPYLGGGMYMRARDMLKFGQMYLNGGAWNNKNILPLDWVCGSLTGRTVLENTGDKNDHGHPWQQVEYEVNGECIEAWEAGGEGGQYIVIVPGFELAVVITSGGCDHNKGARPEKAMREYVLPALFEVNP